MTDIDLSTSVATISTNHDLYVTGSALERTGVLFIDATSTWTPVVGDVLCYKTDDSNKHAKYDETDVANLVIMGVIDQIDISSDGTPVTILQYATEAMVHYGALLVTGVDSDAKKLVLVNALRAKNIEAVT